METKFTLPSYPVDTYEAESKGDTETETKCIDYPGIAYKGAVIQHGKIASGRPLFAGSN